MAKLPPTEIVTGKVRLHWPSLFKKRAAKGASRETYQATVLIPPGEDITPYINAAKAGFAAKHGESTKMPNRNNPVKDASDQDGPGYDQAEYFIRANANFPPAVVDQAKKPILDKSDFTNMDKAEQEAAVAEAEQRIYAGCWVRFHLRAYGWQHEASGKGVSFDLVAVQLMAEGERLMGGGSSSADAFSALDDADDDASDLF